MDRGVLVVGESLVDIVQTPSGRLHEYAGGSAANVAVALARLGRPTRLATSFAPDHHGELIAAHLERAGVALACDPAAVERTAIRYRSRRGNDVLLEALGVPCCGADTRQVRGVLEAHVARLPGGQVLRVRAVERLQLPGAAG